MRDKHVILEDARCRYHLLNGPMENPSANDMIALLSFKIEEGKENLKRIQSKDSTTRSLLETEILSDTNLVTELSLIMDRDSISVSQGGSRPGNARKVPYSDSALKCFSRKGGGTISADTPVGTTTRFVKARGE